ncbi:MAG: chromosome segregation protein SMC [Minwuia sp.]|uniref:chromosome segregation protein SMC n=1 Tax=Minwuia sp. TaxID=2493630 RepID=UPI003A86E412
MAMQFKGLRLVGFKSFVENTELVIQPGMTGVVGPNGCGKSNLVEALRWVMGETSAKNMRGGEMNDVIFAGSGTRPARNTAEVQVALDNSEGDGPPDYANEPELAITRKITRDQGSDYKINGAPVRAKDVQLLFADMATGARSTAIVSQGRVGALIGAKPTERRMLLEEAAGITGLHSRRHEAELRLKGAETNLERLDDVTQQLDQQLGNLKKQARQAARYRNLSAQARQVEAMIHHLRYTASLEALNAARQAMDATQAEVSEATRKAAAVTTRQVEQAARIDPLRKAEAEKAAALNHLNIARERLDAEEARLNETVRNLSERAAQAEEDLRRESERTQDSADRLKELDREAETLTVASQGEDQALEKAGAALKAASEAVQSAEQELSAATETLAELRARRSALARRAQELQQKKADLERRVASAERELAAAASGDHESRLKALEGELDTAREAVEALAGEIDTAEQARAAAETRLNEAAEADRKAKSALSGLKTEIDTLARLLAKEKNSGHARIIDLVKVAPGYENAFAAALGDGVEGALEPDAPARWTEGDADSGDLPKGAEALAVKVEGPAALNRRLQATAVVADIETGERLADQLRPGQRLVTAKGDLWRWDGYRRRAGKQASGAIRLEQQNRLAALQAQQPEAETAARDAEAGMASARNAVARAIEAERNARNRRREAEQQVQKTGQALEVLRRQAEAERQKKERIAALLEGARNELAAATEEAGAAEAEMQGLPAVDGAEADVNARRERVRTAREELDRARQALDRIEREKRFRVRRLEEIARDRKDWVRRSEEAGKACAALAERRDAARQAIEDLKERPAEIEAQRTKLLSEIADAEGARREAIDQLSGAEMALAEADRDLKAAQAEVQAARETLVRRESAVEHGVEELRRLTREIQESMECAPQKVLEVAGLDPDAVMPPLDDCERKLDRLKRERENMGPVNLRAEIEANEVQEKLDTLAAERADLEGAIARLRQGIYSINREARARLLEAFETVNGHFEKLFRRVFGGGEARLALTEAEDPLEAGLEIMASPPGKRMQILTLLSGGEQALTATALLFAVFLTNPAPICVLDEIDAPLDDANVERLTDLLDELASHKQTRFLVITHNPITMARMDRLFGVTMAERGVSQLVSVDLQQAALMRETA